MTIKKLHSHDIIGTRTDIASDYDHLYFDDQTNTILLPDPTGILETKIGVSSTASQLPGYRGVCVDDGVPVQLDGLIVQLNTGNPRSLQFKLATGTMSVRISGEIYWCPGNYQGTYEAKYWTGDTLNTTFQQIFPWSFPWAGDKAVYNVIDQTNRRLYRITLIIGAGYKNNFIVMERLV